MENIEMIAGIHLVVTTTFFIFFFYKTVLLLMNRNEQLDNIRAKTKFIDMVLGILIIASGVFLMVKTGNHSMWLNIKALGVFAAIPLGIIGMKKGHKILSIASFALLLFAYGVGEMKPWNKGDLSKEDNLVQDSTATADIGDSLLIVNDNKDSIIAENTMEVSYNAKEVYMSKCSNCHGEDGRLSKFRSSNLATSRMSSSDRKAIITNGLGVMRSYKDELTEAEIEGLVVFLTTLRR